MCRWCYVHIFQQVLCTHGTCGVVVHVVLCICVIVLWVLCIHCIMTCVIFVLYSVYAYAFVVLCICICNVLYTGCRSMYYVVLYTRFRCMYCVVLYVVCGCMHVMYTMCICMWLEKRSIGCFPSVATNLMCIHKGKRIKAEGKDRLKDKYKHLFNFLLYMWSVILIHDYYMWSMIYDGYTWSIILIMTVVF